MRKLYINIFIDKILFTQNTFKDNYLDTPLINKIQSFLAALVSGTTIAGSAYKYIEGTIKDKELVDEQKRIEYINKEINKNYNKIIPWYLEWYIKRPILDITTQSPPQFPSPYPNS